MSLVITNPKAEQLAQMIGGTIPDAVVRAPEAQLLSLKSPSTTAITLPGFTAIPVEENAECTVLCEFK